MDKFKTSYPKLGHVTHLDSSKREASARLLLYFHFSLGKDLRTRHSKGINYSTFKRKNRLFKSHFEPLAKDSDRIDLFYLKYG